MTDIYGRPSDPPEEIETIFVDDVLVRSAHGIFIPQVFTQQVEKLSCVPDWAWENCLKGPEAFEDQADYWDSWSEILDTFEYRRTGPGGSTQRCFLDYENGGDLCLMYEIVEFPIYGKE